MYSNAPHPARPARHDRQLTMPRASRLADAARALRFAGAMLNFSSQFVPLGDNGELLADLAARARAARDYGA
jgi:hypothetical protein